MNNQYRFNNLSRPIRCIHRVNEPKDIRIFKCAPPTRRGTYSPSNQNGATSAVVIRASKTQAPHTIDERMQEHSPYQLEIQRRINTARTSRRDHHHHHHHAHAAQDVGCTPPSSSHTLGEGAVDNDNHSNSSSVLRSGTWRPPASTPTTSS